MRLFVETNFVLELALQQGEWFACETLMGLAERGRITLTMPAYCVGEPYETLIRRGKQRRAMVDALSNEVRQLARSEPNRDLPDRSRELIRSLIEASDRELTRLNEVLTRILAIGSLLATDRDVVMEALGAQSSLRLGPQDSIVYAAVRRSVVSATGPKCFANRNTKDFLLPQIVDEFHEHDCRIVGSFAEALAWTESPQVP